MDAHVILLALVIIGIISLPYGIYEIWRGSGSAKAKAIITAIVVGLFIVETIFTI